MGQSTEEIEAKLAAYVDGALDDAGRADIEKHLATHPQHRVLLDDLSRQRDLLRSLPAEKAPPEIMEAIQSHLERRLLLEENAEVAGRIGPSVWSRVMPIAAVLILAATLGLVIYSVVPSSRGVGDEFAIVDPTEVTPAAPSTPLASGGATRLDPSASPGGARVADGVTSALAERVAAAAVDALQPGELTVGGETMAGTSLASAARPERAIAPPAISLDRESTAAAGSASVLLLVADDPAAIERDLSKVLNDNAVMFSQVASAAPRDDVSRAGEAGRPDAAPTTGPAFGESNFAGGTIRGTVEAERSRLIPNSALANAGRRAGEPQNDSVFYAPKLSRAQYQAINDALTRIPGAKQQEIPPELRQQQQIAAQVQYSVLKESNEDAKDKLEDAGRELKKDFDAPVPPQLGAEQQKLAAKSVSQATPTDAPAGSVNAPQEEALTDVVIVVRGASADEAAASPPVGQSTPPAGSPTTAPAVAPTTSPATQPGS